VSSNSDRRQKPKPGPPQRSGAPSTGKEIEIPNRTLSSNRLAKEHGNRSSHPPGQPKPDRSQRSLTGARLWLIRLALLVLTPISVLLVAEGALRLFGYGYPVTFFVRSGSTRDYVTNDKFAWQFFSKRTVLKPFLFTLPAQKPAGCLRICILGESAAMGTPDPAFSFGRLLEAMLRRQYPQSRFEVMNAAMRGINSHVVRLIAQECARHQVDVFIVYTGNNEVVGLHAPDPDSSPWAQSLLLIRAGQWARRTRLGQLLSGALHSETEPGTQDMESFRRHRLRADDWRRDKNCQNFRANLQDILRVATDSGAKVILCSVAVNLKDLPPFGSLHRAELTSVDIAHWDSIYSSGMELESQGQFPAAVNEYLAAERIDDHYAELHFHLGRCYGALQDWDEARKEFGLARDWDALQFRTDSRMNQIIRDAAASHKGADVRLLDMEKAFAESELSDHGLPGQKLFYEHVHPTFAGNYLLARACDGALIADLSARLPTKQPQEIPTAGQCAEDIAYTFYDDVNVNAAMVRLTSGPPFLDQVDHSKRQAAAEADNQRRLSAFSPQAAQLCLNTYTAALSRRPDDWPIHFNLALLCQELKRDAQALEQFQYLVRRFPKSKNFRLGLANALLNTGDRSAAVVQFKVALQLGPDDEALAKQINQLEPAGSAP